jgi:ferrochelatase
MIAAEPKRAILLLAHGTPDELSDIPKYLSNVVSGRPMPQSVIDEITHRYSLIGKSPLTALTLEQGRLLSEAIHLPVYVGMRNWKPYIVETVRQMKADGVTEAVAICLAPQNSRTSVGLYRRAVFAEAGDAIRIDFINSWADNPKLAEAFAARLAPVLTRLTEETGATGAPAAVLFTAHSVPCRTIQTPAAGAQALAIGAPTPGRPPAAAPSQAAAAPAPASIQGDAKDLRSTSTQLTTPGASTSPAAGTAAPTAPPIPEHDPSQWVRSSAEEPSTPGRPALGPDPYPVDAKRTAALVASLIPGLTADRWYFAFQSQGMAGGPWIGPTVEDTLTALHAQGVRAVVLDTIGFLCDHVEILYDIDIAFREYAENLGMRLERPASLNDSPLLTEALAGLAYEGLARLANAQPAFVETR